MQRDLGRGCGALLLKAFFGANFDLLFLLLVALISVLVLISGCNMHGVVNLKQLKAFFGVNFDLLILLLVALISVLVLISGCNLHHVVN